MNDSNQITLDSLSDRISKLERRNHLFLAIICILISIVVALISIAATPDETKDFIKTKSLIIVDDSGKEQGRFGIGIDNRLSLELRDPDSVLRGLWGIKRDGTPSIYFYDEKSEERVDLSFAPDGSLALTLFDANGEKTFIAPVQKK